MHLYYPDSYKSLSEALKMKRDPLRLAARKLAAPLP
jgi:hypothetical protein